MQPIKTFVVYTGREKRSPLDDADCFSISPDHRFDIESEVELSGIQDNYLSSALGFANIPAAYWPNLVSQLVAVASSLSDDPRPRTTPKLFAIVESNWASASGTDAVTAVLNPVLATRGWKQLALRYGIVVCVVTDSPETLEPTNQDGRAKRLLEDGVDLIKDGRTSPASLAADVERRFALLTRQRKWAATSMRSSLFKMLLAFLLFGICQAIATQLIDRISHATLGPLKSTIDNDS